MNTSSPRQITSDQFDIVNSPHQSLESSIRQMLNEKIGNSPKTPSKTQASKSEEDFIPFLVGDRIHVSRIEKNGRTKFIGSTHFSSGIWVGVELFEGCGKNDGSMQGRRYFNCTPFHGIFVRPSSCSKITAIQETAIQEKNNGKHPTFECNSENLKLLPKQSPIVSPRKLSVHQSNVTATATTPILDSSIYPESDEILDDINPHYNSIHRKDLGSEEASQVSGLNPNPNPNPKAPANIPDARIKNIHTVQFKSKMDPVVSARGYGNGNTVRSNLNNTGKTLFNRKPIIKTNSVINYKSDENKSENKSENKTENKSENKSENKTENKSESKGENKSENRNIDHKNNFNKDIADKAIPENGTEKGRDRESDKGITNKVSADKFSVSTDKNSHKNSTDKNSDDNPNPNPNSSHNKSSSDIKKKNSNSNSTKIRSEKDITDLILPSMSCESDNDSPSSPSPDNPVVRLGLVLG
jgi:hypothetical protein